MCVRAYVNLNVHTCICTRAYVCVAPLGRCVHVVVWHEFVCTYARVSVVVLYCLLCPPLVARGGSAIWRVTQPLGSGDDANVSRVLTYLLRSARVIVETCRVLFCRLALSPLGVSNRSNCDAVSECADSQTRQCLLDQIFCFFIFLFFCTASMCYF